MEKITEWFDVHDIEHLQAYKHLSTTGHWPEGFIPSRMEFPAHWQITIAGHLVRAYLQLVVPD